MKDFAAISQFDLNLLYVFYALLQERNVTRAARRLRKSQPATSEALSKLRIALDDPLFIRRGSRMEPTFLARQLEPLVEQIVAGAARLQAPESEFQLAEASGEISLCMTEYCASILLPRLLDEVRQKAPNLTVKCTPAYMQSIEAGIRNSSFDLAIGALDGLGADFQQATLFEEDIVCVMDKAHPLARDKKVKRLSQKLLTTYPHLKVSVYREDDSLIDELFAVQNTILPDTVTIGQFLLAPHVLKNRDYLFLCGSSLAKLFLQEFHSAFVYKPLSKPLAKIPVKMLWHQRTHHNPLHRWVREVIQS